ncbi:hypothetical protein O9H85_20160 [Paenibacillus filicis]|uniref:Uncharacterized protein n=1 Tax=Paenibacillus gyeongsangnamensis TaxID=3388067 RepID=A0ABT4QCU3_9BACL|nr:hypothetical protein [Paenibacillus filicis]MCZ8514697.1 hypothetical protein [Paenibacillus filicis]
MARGILDVIVSDSMDDNEIILVTECYNGYAEELQTIAEGAVVTLKKGDSEREVKVLREKGDECAFHYMEVGNETASELGLVDGARYLLEYDAVDSTIKLTRVKVSRAQVPVRVDRTSAGKDRITIGYSLLSQLGMTTDNSKAAVLKDGKETAKLRFHIPENELDGSFRVPSFVAAMFGLQDGELCQLEYNQTTKVLQCTDKGLMLSCHVLKPRNRSRSKSAASATRKKPAKGLTVTTDRPPRLPLRQAGPRNGLPASQELKPAMKPAEGVVFVKQPLVRQKPAASGKRHRTAALRTPRANRRPAGLLLGVNVTPGR